MKIKKILNKLPKYLTLSVILLVLVSISYYAINYVIVLQKNKQIEKIINKKSDLTGIEVHKNKYGQQWQLPSNGKKAFKIGGKIISGPEFVKAEINPLKVSVGQKQFMKVEINSAKELDKVMAEITTDHKIVKVELKQTTAREITYADVNSQPFAVKDNGEVVLKSDNKTNSRLFAELTNTLFNKAKAANTMRYTFEGSWVVYDTGDTTYTTNFIAYDKDNQFNNVVMAWSDPCSLPISNQVDWATGSLQQNKLGYFSADKNNFNFANNSGGSICSSQNIIGIENVNYIIREGFTLSVLNDSLIFTPGKTITIVLGGKISLPDTTEEDPLITQSQDPAIGQITKGYLWVYDADGDGYYPADTLSSDKIYTLHKMTRENQLGNNIFNKISTAYKKAISLFNINKIVAVDECDSVPTPTWRGQRTIDENHNFLATNTPKIDCDETKRAAHSDSTVYCSSKTGNNDYDWNCDGTINKSPEYIIQPPNGTEGGYVARCNWTPSGGNPHCHGINLSTNLSNYDGYVSTVIPDRFDNPYLGSGFNNNLTNVPSCGEQINQISYNYGQQDNNDSYCHALNGSSACRESLFRYTTTIKSVKCQ